MGDSAHLKLWGDPAIRNGLSWLSFPKILSDLIIFGGEVPGCGFRTSRARLVWLGSYGNMWPDSADRDAAGEDITHTVLTGHAFRLLAPAKSSGYVNVQFHRFVRLPIRGLR